MNFFAKFAVFFITLNIFSLCFSPLQVVSATECTTNPCVFGTCNNYTSNYNCTCDNGYEGILCGDAIDYCADSPCQNSGICTTVNFTYSCNCVNNFVGATCGTSWCDCDENESCMNTTANNLGFVCVDSYCITGNNPCSVHSNCTATNNGLAYTCDCEAGFLGEFCTYVDIFSEEFALEINYGLITDPTGSTTFSSSSANFNATQTVVSGGEVVNWDDVSSEIPAVLMNYTTFFVILDNEADQEDFYVSILLSSIFFTQIDENGTVRTDWDTFSWGDVVTSSSASGGGKYFPVEYRVQTCSDCLMLPFCSGINGCDGFSIFSSRVTDLADNAVGFVVDFDYFAQAQALSTSSYALAADDSHVGISDDSLRSYGSKKVVVLKSWFTGAEPPAESSSSSLSSAAIAGIIVGSIIGGLLLLFCLWRRHKSLHGKPQRSTGFGR